MICSLSLYLLIYNSSHRNLHETYSTKATTKKQGRPARASVITKWFVQEEYSINSLKLRDDYINCLVDIAAPDLLPFEVINSLRYNPEFGEKDIEESAKALEKYSLWLFPILGKLAEKTIENAFKYGITIHD
jgi:predicted nucleic acid-binding protein